MKRFVAAAVLTAVITAVLLVGCGGAHSFKKESKTFYNVMNSQAELTVYEVDGEVPATISFESLSDSVGDILVSLDNTLSATEPESCVNKFNMLGAGETMVCDEDFYNVLKTALSVHGITSGYYNPAIYYSVRAYGFLGKFPLSAGELPTDGQTAAYADLAQHFADIELSENGGVYYVTKPVYTVEYGGEELSLKIDLGGIGKGYAVDKVNALMKEKGFVYGYFSFGTSSIAVGRYPDDDLSFTIGFTNPRRRVVSGVYTDPAEYVKLAVKDDCVSTSGDYENFYELDADGDGVVERYCHIFDPFTGKPVNKSIITATVIGGSAAEDDAMTTAIMAMGRDKAEEFIGDLQSRRAVFAFIDNGSLRIFSNIPESEIEVVDNRFTRQV